MKNKENRNLTNSLKENSVNAKVKRRGTIWRTAVICLLFIATVLTAVFGISGLTESRGNLSEKESQAAYAATNANAANGAAWEAATYGSAKGTAANPALVTLSGNWIAEPMDADSTVAALRRTEFPHSAGTQSSASAYGNSYLRQSYSAGKTNYSGALLVPANVYVILDLNGYTIDRNIENGIGAAMQYGYVILVRGNLTIIDSSSGKTGKITGGWNSYTRNDHNPTEARGGGVVIASSGTLTLESGSITGNKCYHGGGGVTNNGGQFIMNGGKITKNYLLPHTTTSNAYSAAGVYSTNGTFTMYDGEITDNVAETTNITCTGGVSANYYNAVSKFIMYGGTISGNKGYTQGSTATGTGGVSGTNNTSVSVELYGGKIINNEGNSAGGVSKWESGILKVGGTPVVKNNYVKDSIDATEQIPWDIDLSSTRQWLKGVAISYRTQVITVVEPLLTGAELYVVKWTNNYVNTNHNAITKGFGAYNSADDPAKFFHPSLPDYSEVSTVMVGGSTREATFINKVDMLNWQDAVNASTTAAPLTVKLYHDLTAVNFENSDGTITPGVFAMPEGLSAEPRGFMFTDLTAGYSNTTTVRSFMIPSGKSVILDLNGHTINKNIADDQASTSTYFIYVNTGTFELMDSKGGGKLTGGNNINTNGGGAILLATGGGKFTMTSGEISGNKARYGGAIGAPGGGGTVNINGGTIKNNEAYTTTATPSGVGGAIYSNGTANININGGTITGNKAEQFGGAIYAHATKYADAVTNKVTVKGGSITGNSAGEGGGGLYFPYQNNYFGLGGNPIIENNTVNGKANNIHLPSVKTSADGYDNGLITIVSPLTGSKSHKYGVYRDINYTFTKDFWLNNPSDKPTDYFKAEREDCYVADEVDANKDGIILSQHGADNWYSAVRLSYALKAKQYTVKLTENWTAVPNANANFSKSLHGDESLDSSTSGSNPYMYGTLNVPSSTNIVLDLNGYTIDRGLANGAAGTPYGMVLIAQGTLKLIDTSTAKSGKLTGGWAHNTAAYYYGGGIYINTAASRVTMEGGTITGNKSTGFDSKNVYYGVGGVGIAVDGAQFTMTGGAICNNLGSFAGGIGMIVLKTNTLKMGGSAKVYDNYCTTDLNAKFGEGTPSDVYNPAATAGTTAAHITTTNTYKIDIVAPFTADAHIGISRPSTNNYTLINYNGNVFTNGYSVQNGTKDPATVFFSSDSDMAEIQTYTNWDNGATEATFWILDASINWGNAVNAGINATTGAPITVTLHKDWIADNGVLGTGTGYTTAGAMNQTKSNIILDLNGYTIDRGLSSVFDGVANGYVLTMSGTCRLEIVDSSAKKTGKITGGNNSTANEAGGINITSATATLLLHGGTITGNKGDLGGVSTYTSTDFKTGNPLKFGGSALVTGNLDLNDRALNINLRANYVQIIDIDQSLTYTGPLKNGVTKNGSSDFTDWYDTFKPVSKPQATDYFVADSATRFVINTADNEGALYTYDNYTNWSFAVNESRALGDTRTVTLISDWIGDSNALLAPDNTDNTTMVLGGALRVSGAAKIILDLNGYTIDRNMTTPTNDGYVIYVESTATLTLRDTSEKQTGTITGGNQLRATDNNNLAGGGVANRGRFYMEGGIITGNYASGHTQSSGGVWNDYESSVPGLFRMTGGTITGNYGVRSGGVNVFNGSQVYVGGSAKIYGNKTLAGEPSDVRAIDDKFDYKINFASSFTKDARIAVHYITNNYSGTLASKVFTAGFYSLNPGASPEDYFESSDPLKYRIQPYTTTAGLEARIECIDNEQNWRQAIAASSSATNYQTVTLSRNWTANNNGTYLTAFGTSTSAYVNGGLQVPAGKFIILDLNGYTIDRALTAQRPNGYVMNLLGTLEIIDSSTRKTGTITGGWSDNTAGGINFVSGSLTITGGTITGNKGTVGGVHINEASAKTLPFAMGDSALITGNTDTYLKDSDIVATNAVQMINILSPLTEKAKGKTGFRRDGVGDFTTGFAAQMPTEDPTDYFKSADPMYVFEYDNGEAALYTNSNQLNWSYAVKASLAGSGKQITFKMLEDWRAIAGEFGENTTGYHYNSGADFGGMLYVPSGANIVLDLNGYKLDRGLNSAAILGNIIRVNGTLTIRDTSETGTGIITGGFNSYNDSNEAAQSSAIWVEGAAKLYIEGGTITGNRATGVQSSAITTDNASAVVQMTGGAITGNYGGPLTAHTGAGGINIRYTKTLKLGGTAKIIGNFHNFGEYDSDVHFNEASQYIEIIAQFKRGAEIGVSPNAQVNNYASGNAEGVQFTSNYYDFHTSVDTPDRYFVGKWYQAHKVVTKNTVNGIEGSLWCMENYTNWINAVAASSDTKTITFQLTEDWTAEYNEKFTTSFHPSNTSYYKNGAIYLPSKKSIILDLAGFKIDRALTGAINDGYALYVDGVLEIIDSSRLKTGVITGANNQTGGGGIVVDKGTLTVLGAQVTGNKGTAGAGVYIMDSGTLKIGENAEIYGNVNAANEPSNVYLNKKTALITVVSALKNRNVIGVSRNQNGNVTADFQKHMTGSDPLTYFVSENSNYYGIEGGDGELFFLSPDNYTNWKYAVEQSIATGKVQTVRLTGDWVAEENSSYGTAFGTGTGFSNGALHVPANAKIELDLAGYTVNRNITSARRYGSVFSILGTLKITDSSEKGTGLITGAKIDTADNNFKGAGIFVGGKATVELLGGTVSGNWNTATAASASGVYVTAGGTFNLKDAAVKSNQSTVAGIYLESGAIFTVSGKAVVEDNKSGAGDQRDVVFASYTNVLSVSGALTDGAHVGIYRVVNNYNTNSFGGSKVTSDYSRYNTQPASTYFFASNSTHGIIDITSGSTTEAGLFCYDNASNWTNAVNASINTKRGMEVKMYGDWTAARNNENTSFGTNTNAYYNGALRVPSSAQITLDLNNSVINRDLPRANANGYVIYVEGNLQIIDTSAAGASQITGGWTTGTSISDTSLASGIHVVSKGKLSLEGGSVTGNNGVGVYLAGSNTFSLGGKTKVIDNIFDGGAQSNIYLHNETQMINVVSEFGSNARFGVMRAKGASNFGSGTLTTNYSKYNKTVNPTTYFTSDDSRYMIVDEGYFDDESMEAAFLGKDNLTNWAHAVKTSLANGGRAQVCTLYEDWTAEDHKSYTKSFGEVSGVNCFYKGSLYVPAKCHVILDLNGHKIDRALTAAIDNGEVIYVRGTLEVIDGKGGGIITGGYSTGNSSSNDNGRAGGIAVYTGTLSLEGGTITGNRSNIYAGGVYLSGGSTLSMLGGKITSNFSKSGSAGGVYVVDTATVRLGGEAYIYDNRIMDNMGNATEQQANVYVTKNTNYVFVTDHFKAGAKVGIAVNVNHVSSSGRLITNGWGSLNNDYEATTVFSSDYPANYALIDYNADGTHEAKLLLRNNKLNWQNAVTTSLNKKTVETFVLYDDWIATPSGNTSSFGSGTGYEGTGNLFVPPQAKIILDLNGHTIDRGLYGMNVNDNWGMVIHVEGELTIIDSTAHLDKNGNIIQGKITGGNHQKYGGGIWACMGVLNIEAGHITKNSGGDNGAGISINNCKVTIGGYAQFSENTMLSNGRKEDIGFYNTNATLYIGSQMIADADATKNEINVRKAKIGQFTSGWGKYNPTTKPETRFKSSLTNYRVASTGTGTQREAVMLSNNNNDNWIFAVQTSISNNEPQYFSLVEDWTATNYSGGSYTTRFGTNSTAYRNGALLVPAGANIVLDLAGCTLERAHALGNDVKYAANNAVIIVEGTLQIVDSSLNERGAIKGGSYGVFLNKNTASVTIGGLIKTDGMVLMGDETNVYGVSGGGSITGNSLYGVYVNNGTFTATGGKVTGNTTSDVFVTKNAAASVNVGENAYIYTENRTAGAGLRLENSLGVINVVSKLSDNARIGFSRQSVGVLTNGWGANNGNDADPYDKIFVSEEPAIYSHKTVTENGFTELYVSSYDNAVNWQYAIDKSLATGDTQEFVLYSCWTATEDETYKTSFGATSAYRNGALYVPEGAKVKLNLNGHKINRNLTEAVQNGMVIYVDGELEITDEKKDNPPGLTTSCCDRSGGVITGGNNSTGSSAGALYVSDKGFATLSGGTVSNNKATSQSASSGAVYAAGEFLMNGGVIAGNVGKYAGAVYIASSGTFAMTDGSIESNTAESGGGAVYATGTVEINGGIITRNKSVIGGIYVASGGKVTMNGGEITANEGGSAGAVFVNNASNTFFTMNGGEITDNTATSAGGIYSAGVVNIKGGLVKGNVATGTTLSNGGGAIYVASTANVTITGGEITENEGENGIRVHAAGILAVGGSARIFNNTARNKTNVGGDVEVEPNDYCDIYFSAASRKLNVVSEFTSDAKIGIYRLSAGVFTTGYGMYNNAHPNTVFVSNRSVYSVSKTAGDDITNTEASIGITVDPEPAILATANVYNGGWQTIIEDIDDTKVVIGTLGEGLQVGTSTDGSAKTIEAVNAGSYIVSFSLKDGYCWKDGSTDDKIIHATLMPKVIKLVWSKEVHRDEEGNDILVAGQPVCTYDGKTVHAPVVVVASDMLETNVLTGEKDTCTVSVSGGTMYASNGDGHTATATSLSNFNYKLGTDDVTYKFVVEKAERPAFAVKSTQTFYNTPTKMEVEGNLENGKLHFFVENEYASIASIDELTGELTVTQLGAKVKIRVVADATDNYKQSTAVSGEIECVVGNLKATISPAEVVYGEKVNLSLSGDFKDGEIGEVTYSIITKVDGVADGSLGNASINAVTGQFEGTGVGDVYVMAHIAASSHYLETTIEGVIKVVPRTIRLKWGDTLTVPYNGSAQTLAAPEYEVGGPSDEGVLPKDKASFSINVYKAGYSGWDKKMASPTWTDVGKYDVGVVLSNSNYALAAETDYFPEFEITKATPDLKFTTLTAYYNIAFKPEVTGNPEGTTVTITLQSNTLGRNGYDYDRSKGEYTPKALGTMTFKAVFAGNKSYEAKEIYGTYNVVQAEMPVEISPTELYYGDNPTAISAGYKDANGNLNDITGASGVEFSLKSEYGEYADLTFIEGVPYITPKKAGTIKLTVKVPANSMYVETTVDAEIVIKPREITVSWSFDTNGYIYNGTVQTPTATITGTLLGGDTVTVSGYEAYQKNDKGELVKVDAKNAGDYIVKAIMGDPNYAMAEASQATFTIKPLAVELQWSNTTLTYNGEDQAPTAGVRNIIEGDTCDVTVLGGKDAGTNLEARATAISNSNYTLDGGQNIKWNFTIKPKEITVTWGDTDLTYTGVQQAPKATANDLIGTDKCEVIVGGGQINVNTGDPYVAEATGLTNANYALNSDVHKVQFNILPAKATVSLKQTTAIYGTPFTLELEGNTAGGAVTITLGEGAENATLGSGNWFTPVNVGTVEVKIDVAATQNYEAFSINPTITISARPIEVNWSDLTFTYDGEPHNATATLANAVNGDPVVLTLSDAKTNAGTYTASVTALTILGANTKLYTLNGGKDVSKEFVINKRVLTVTWSDTEFIYDGDEHAPTATLGNLVDGESCTATVKGAKDAGVRILAEITALSNSNYTVDGADNATTRFNIAQRLAKLVWTDTTLPFTGSDQLPTATVSNLVPGDTCTVTLSGAASEVGKHTATATALSNSNYTLVFDEEETDPEKITQLECEFEIVKAELEIELTANEVVFGTDLTLSLVNNPSGKSATFTTVAGGTGSATITEGVLKATKAGTVKINVHVDESDNYEATDEEVEVTIKKLPVVITWVHDDFVYDKTEKKPTATVSNAVEGYPCNIVTVEGATNAGENLQAKVTAISDTDNYTLEGGTDITASFVIKARPVTMITWDGDRTYPFTGESQGPNAKVSGILSGDECKVTVSGWKVNVGNYTAEITGLSNSNYSLDGMVDLTADFEITISKPTPSIKTKEIVIGNTETIEIEGNIGKGNVTFEIIEGSDYGDIVGDKLYGKMLGTVKIKAKVDATSNTEAAEVTDEIKIIKGKAPLKLEKTSVMYGSTLTLTMDDDRGNLRLPDSSLMYGTVTFTVEPRFADVAEITDGNVLKPKAAGTIRVRMATADTDYFDATSTTVEITITQRIVSLDWTDGTYTYSGKEQAPEVKITNIVGNDKVELTVVGGKDVGDYTAKVTGLSGLDSKNYTLERATNTEKDFHINPYVLSLTWGDLNIPYNGEEQTPEAIIEPLDADKENCKAVLVVEGEHKNVGEYTVKATGVNNTNYVLDKEYETKYNIVRADLKPKFSPDYVVYGTTEVLTLLGNYDNAAYELEVMKNDSVGLGTLSKNAEGNYEFTATRAGIVKIKVKVDATTNCNAFDDVLELEVIKADREISLVSAVGVYGEDLELELSGNDDDPGMVVYTVVDSQLATITGNKLTPKHAANVTILIVIGATENYNAVREVVQVTINPRIVHINWKNSEFTYNGEVQMPEAEVDNLINGDTCEIEVGGGKINAGTYTDAHIVSVSNPDYTIEGSTSASGHVFTIGKKSIDIDIEPTRMNMGDSKELKVTGNEGNAAVTFTVENGTGKASLKDGKTLVPEDVGSVTVTAQVAESQNYLGATKSKIIIIDKSQLKLTLKKNTVQYGDNLDLEVEGNVENQDIYFAVVPADGDGQIIGGSTLATIKAGKVIVTAKIAATDNYAESSENFEVTITPIEVELIWSNFEFTYDGKNIFAPTATVRSGLIGTDECVVNVKGGQLEVGTYETAYADDDSLSNKNYTLGGKTIKAPQFVINRASPAITIATKVVTLNVPTKIELLGNAEFGQVDYQLGEVTDPAHVTEIGTATLDGTTGIITGTALGYVHVIVTVMPTKNYNGGTAECDIKVDRPEAPIDIENKQIVFGNEYSLGFIIMEGFTDDYSLSDFSYSATMDLDSQKDWTGDAEINHVSNSIKAKKAGIVNVIIHVDATENFRETDKIIEIEILPLVLEFRWVEAEFEYDGTEKIPTSFVTNFPTADWLGSQEINTTEKGSVYVSDEATAEILSVDNPNYTLEGSTTATTTFVIRPRTVVLTWTYPELTYSGTEQAPEATVSNVVSVDGETDHVSVTVQGSVNAGENLTATAIGLSNLNYTLLDSDGNTIESATTTFTIKPYAVYIEWGELSLEYTGSVNVPSATAFGTLNNDVVNATVVGVGECIHASSAPYQATATGLDNTNYTLKAPEAVVATRGSARKAVTGSAGALTTNYYITPATVTLNERSLKKEYNGTPQDPDIELMLLNTDDELTLEYTNGKQTAVGEYEVTLNLSGSSINDYVLAEEDETKKFTIAPKTINVKLTTKDTTSEFTGESVKLTDWYILSADGFVGEDAGKSVEEIFTTNTLKINPIFELADGTTQTAVGTRGTYKLSADLTSVTGELSGNSNYKAVLVLDTESTPGTLTISGGESLKLAADSEYDFLNLDARFEYGEYYYYRETYKSKEWTHGKDDSEMNRVVLGNIQPDTCVGDFLNNFEVSQLNSIRIYDCYGDLIFDCGQPAEGVYEEDLYDATYYSVGTGWKVMYGKDLDAAETVYISVLGDIDGDGTIGGEDMAEIGKYIRGENGSMELETMLAMLLDNFGYVSAEDVSLISSAIRNELDTKELF